MTHKLYSVICDDAVRYDVIADSEDECQRLICAFVDPGPPPSKWTIAEVGHAERGPTRVFNFAPLASETIGEKKHPKATEPEPPDLAWTKPDKR